jgi:hypothetical protein
MALNRKMPVALQIVHRPAPHKLPGPLPASPRHPLPLGSILNQRAESLTPKRV